MSTYTVGKLAAMTGVGKETVRFYERKGLLPEPLRDASRYRRYSNDDVRRINFIRRAKDLGFSLSEIKQLLDFRADAGADCSQVRAILQQKVVELERHIRSLREMWVGLTRLAEECPGDGPVNDCPILAAIG